MALVGAGLISAAIISASQFSPDILPTNSLFALSNLHAYRVALAVCGAAALAGGIVLILLAPALSRRSEEEILRKLGEKRVVLVGAVLVWVLLYLIYVLAHEIPVNPAGYYLEAARQLLENGLLPPRNVKGFGAEGIPFVYPPLGFYLLAAVGYLLGEVHRASLFIPGILVPLQGLAMYAFMKTWRGSERAAQWAAVALLFAPFVFYRTLYGDGITTGLAGVFLLLSWRFAVKEKQSGSYRSSLIGGILVGLCILSHPALGLYCAVTFSLLLLSTMRPIRDGILNLVTAGAAASLVVLPWLAISLARHGLKPYLAGLGIGPGFTSQTQGLGSLLQDLYENYAGGRGKLWLLLFPFPLTLLYNLLRGPRVILLLVLAAVFPFSLHPTTTTFALAASLGVFFSEVLLPALERDADDHQTEQAETDASKVTGALYETRYSLALAAIYLGFLFVLNLGHAVRPALTPGELSAYRWIAANTDPKETFLMEGNTENLAYFGEREIWLPFGGAEWVPDREYGSAKQRGIHIKGELFGCREEDCLEETLRRYELQPDYLVFRVESQEEAGWLERLGQGGFELAFAEGNMAVVRITY